MKLTAKFLAALIAFVPGMAMSARKDPKSSTFEFKPIPVEPEPEQEHLYTSDAKQSPHQARGEGLHAATTGVPASFTIELVGEDGEPADLEQDGRNFVYVWIASQDQIFHAEVVNNGNGTLTATYESSFPGDYLVYVEEVKVAHHDEGRPIAGSPFELKILGDPVLNVDELPLCGSVEKDIESSFWEPGTWVSSRLASAPHGVLRDGWVFQPKSCVYDAFTYDDLMLLASLPEETSLLVLGGSVQRGVFLTLVDMILTKGQKEKLISSILAKCWGYASVKVGNLRVTYQDFRLYTFNNVQDVVVCNNEKLASGSSAEFVQSCRDFMKDTAFGDGTSWPSVLFAPSNFETKRKPNLATKVVIGTLPSSWKGKLIMVDHMAGFGNQWAQDNPTMSTLEGVGLRYKKAKPMGKDELEKMRNYKDSDSRIDFMSVFPVIQGKLFENQGTRPWARKYGRSIHFHYISSDAGGPETKDGERMVQSTVTEMLANIIIGKAVGSKAALYDKANTLSDEMRSGAVGEVFEVEHDCPAALLPFHVNPVPELTHMTVESLPVSDWVGNVWDRQLCPSWCMEQKPVSQTHTESGPVYVRECRP